MHLWKHAKLPNLHGLPVSFILSFLGLNILGVIHYANSDLSLKISEMPGFSMTSKSSLSYIFFFTNLKELKNNFAIKNHKLILLLMLV